MKKVLLTMFFAMTALVGWSQDIMGKWVTEAGDAQVEIYQQGDKVNGKIVWLKQGPETKDKHNGLNEVQVSDNVARRDTSLNLTYAFLLLCYGDSTEEEITVPMVKHDGQWLMK